MKEAFWCKDKYFLDASDESCHSTNDTDDKILVKGMLIKRKENDIFFIYLC